jgi:hypothetical protein
LKAGGELEIAPGNELASRRQFRYSSWPSAVGTPERGRAPAAISA